MSKNNKKELKDLSLTELKAKAVDLESELFKLRLQKVAGQLPNTALIKAARKNLARVKTYHSQKQVNK